MATDIPVTAWAGVLSTSIPATTLPSGRDVPITSSLISKPLEHQFAANLPGNPVVNGHSCVRASRNFFCKGSARSLESATVLRFRTDASVIELCGVSPDGLHVITTLLVDGKRVPPVALSSSRGTGGWNVGTIRMAFGSRRYRDIWITTSLYCAFVRIDAGDSLQAVDDAADPQLTVIGDSYQQVSSSAFGNGALPFEVAARLGIRKVATDALGGTGFRNSGGDAGNLGDRLVAHRADQSAIYLIVAGLNDSGDRRADGTIAWPTGAVYEQAVNDYLQNLRAAQPDALIVVTAPFCPVPPMSDASYVGVPLSNPSGLGDFLYKEYVHRTAVQKLSAPWIYIDVLMGTGWLNSSGASGDVSNLQWFTGGTPGIGTTAAYRPGNTQGGGGGGFGGIAHIPIEDGGTYLQAPEIVATGGSGSGLLATSVIDAAGRMTAIRVICSGTGYTPGSGLPVLTADSSHAVVPGRFGPPSLIAGINPDGQYPLPEFAPSPTADLNNIFTLLSSDLTHPSPAGVEYLARRLALNIHDAVLAL